MRTLRNKKPTPVIVLDRPIRPVSAVSRVACVLYVSHDLSWLTAIRVHHAGREVVMPHVPVCQRARGARGF